MLPVLNSIFNICIIVGFAIPLLNILTGWFGGIFGVGVDIDADVDMDVDFDASADASIDGGAQTNIASHAVIPFNIMCLCLFLIVFGATGHIAKGYMANILFTVLLLIGCFLIAGLSYWALYKLVIERLKRSDASALKYHDLRGKCAEVTLKIQTDSIGTISLRDSTGAPISFRAKIDPDLKDQIPDAIQQGESVVITEVDTVNKLCYVSVRINKLQ